MTKQVKRRTVNLNLADNVDHSGPGSLKPATGSKFRAFNSVLLNSVLATSWCPPGSGDDYCQKRYSMAITALIAFKPQDEIDGMIAAQAVAMHLASMECFRRAMLAEQPGEVAARLRKDGANLARGMTEMIAALDRKRGKTGNQTVRVEHVTVQAGGQAIVGNVVPGKPGVGDRIEPQQEPYGPPARVAHDATLGTVLPPVRSKDAERVPVPISGDGER